MAFPVAEFSVVLDKGTLDAIMTDSAEETMILVDKMFGEIDRVLRIGGRYVCISLAQEHILNKITQYFVERYWKNIHYRSNMYVMWSTDVECHCCNN